MLQSRLAWPCLAVLIACSGGTHAADRIGSRLSAHAIEKAPLPPELGNQSTNVSASSGLSPQKLGELSDQSRCGIASDNMDGFALVSGFSTRGGGSSTEIRGDVLESGGIWRGLYWSRRPDSPVCAFKAEPDDAGARLVFYGIRHGNEKDAVQAAENGKFFCSCASLSR